MALVKNFKATSSLRNEIALTWDQPEGFNTTDDEIIVTRTITHYPMELFNESFPTKATDSRPLEIYRGKTIVGLDSGSVSVLGEVLTDTSASFPTSPNLNGRILRDVNSQHFTIISNTSTTLTLDGEPTSGRYVILPDFPTVSRVQQSFENDIRTTVNTNSITNLVQLINGSLLVQSFEVDELANLIFKDGNNTVFVVKNNTANTIYFFERFNFYNNSLVEFSYDNGTGIVQYSSAVNLSDVVAGNLFVDSSGNKFEILSVDDSLDQVVLDTGLIVDDSSPGLRLEGSIIINDMPVVGTGMSLLGIFVDEATIPYKDTFKNYLEAAARVGTGLQDNQFYYYTAFNKDMDANVAQAEFSTVDSNISTQSAAISIKDRSFEKILYNYWPSLYRDMDETGDLEDLMKVFAFQFGELHALIDSYRLQDTHTVFTSVLVALADQTGLPSVGYSVGIDTLRRVAADMITAWHLKGSKEGIALFIRIITTWDITNGTGDFDGSISDFLPNVAALRFFDANLGSLNTRITKTDPFVSGGRFAKSLPGIVIPGFFTFREFVVTIPEVALFIGATTLFTVSSGNTIIQDNTANFGADNSLVGNFILPNQSEVNDLFQIIANTSTTITVKGVIENRNPGGDYAILSPLNTNRFIILIKLIPNYIPYGTKAGFRFI